MSTPASYSDRPNCAREARGLLVRQLGQRRLHARDVRGVDLHRQQVRIREVAVVVGFFLRTHAARLALVGVVEPRFLHHLAAAFDHVDLARDFVVDGLLDVAERIDVLDLGARAELLGADLAHRHVGVAAERAFLHVAVADLEVAHQRVHLLEIGHRLFRRAHVGLGDDFDERRAGAIEVDAGLLRQPFVQRLARVLFEMRARDADALLRAVVEHDVHVALRRPPAARTG